MLGKKILPSNPIPTSANLVKIKKGELLDAETVKREAAEVGNLITQKLYNMVYKLAPLLVGVETQKQAKDILESEVEIVLEELNRMSDEL